MTQRQIAGRYLLGISVWAFGAGTTWVFIAPVGKFRQGLITGLIVMFWEIAYRIVRPALREQDRRWHDTRN